MKKCYKILIFCAALSAVLISCQQKLFAQENPIPKGDISPVVVQQPTSKDFQKDIKTLQLLSKNRDLNGLVSTTDKLKDKWLTTDKQSYYSILSEACADLTSYDFGISNISKQHDAVEEYAMDALKNGATMPLGMRAYFVEHLIYAPGHGMSGATGEDWSRLRSKRALLWLSTWQQIRQRTRENFSVKLVEPKLPPRQFISQRVIINGHVDPNNITDAGERAKYVAALQEYISNYQLAMDQEDLERIKEYFLPLAIKYITAFYSSPPYNTNELTQYLNKSLLDPEIKNEILTEVRQNIRQNAIPSEPNQGNKN